MFSIKKETFTSLISLKGIHSLNVSVHSFFILILLQDKILPLTLKEALLTVTQTMTMRSAFEHFMNGNGAI